MKPLLFVHIHPITALHFKGFKDVCAIAPEEANRIQNEYAEEFRQKLLSDTNNECLVVAIINTAHAHIKIEMFNTEKIEPVDLETLLKKTTPVPVC